MAEPAPSLDELTTPIPRKEFEESLYRVMAAIGLKPSTWKPGAVVRAMVTAVSVVFYCLSVLISLVNRLGFLELSSGVWLRLCAKWGFGVEYLGATTASGLVRIDNSGGGVFDEPAGEMRFIGGEGQEYVATQRVQVAAYQTGVFANVRATSPGKIGSAPAGTITRFGAAYSGLTVTNPTAFNASNDESDASLQERARDEAASGSPNGPIDAYRAWARKATRADGSNLGIERVSVVRGPGDRSCTVYAANASGSVPGTANDPTTDLGCLQAFLSERACPKGMRVTAASADPVVVNVQYEIWAYYENATEDAGFVAPAEYTEAVMSAISSAILDHASELKLGGDRKAGQDYILRNRFAASIMQTIPNNAAFDYLLTSPSADVPCGPSGALVIGTISGVIHWVDPVATVA